MIDHFWEPPMRNVPGVGEVFELAFNPDGSVYPGEKETGDWIFHFSGSTSMVFPAGLVGIRPKGFSVFQCCCEVDELHPDSKECYYAGSHCGSPPWNGR